MAGPWSFERSSVQALERWSGRVGERESGRVGERESGGAGKWGSVVWCGARHARIDRIAPPCPTLPCNAGMAPP